MSGHDVVIGGGASGVVMAANLLRQGDRQVTLVTADPHPGLGIAYGTTDPDHLLNTRVGSMSAFPDAPADFTDWLGRNGFAADPDAFMGRAVYGRYLQDLLTPWSHDPRLTIIRATATRLDKGKTGVTVSLDNSRSIPADRAILATGHPTGETAGLDSAWTFDGHVPPDGMVVIVGTGLSMVDQVLSLLKAGHGGPIVAVSRRTLLPLPHGEQTTHPRTVTPPDGAPVSQILKWARTLAREIIDDGGTWQDAVDSLRPHAQTLWRGMSQARRRRFLRHGASWWGIHRHRIPPQSWTIIQAALQCGQLQLRRGSFRAAKGGMAHIHHRGHEAGIGAERIIDCRGILRDLERDGTPLIRDLLGRGMARMDPLRIGLDVTDDGALIDAEGRAHPDILALGPVARAALWEITAIPDIREQAARFAAMPQSVGG